MGPHLTRLQTAFRLGHADTVDRINGVPLSNGAARALENLIKNVEGDRFDRGVLADANGHVVFSHAKMSDVAELINEHWTSFKTELPERLSNGKPLGQAVFYGMFKRVREARNDAYHHREVSRRREIMAVAEELLDLIGIHLSSTLDCVVHAAVKVPKPTMEAGPKHLALPEPKEIFRVERISGRKAARVRNVSASGTGDALSRELANLSGDERSQLTSLSVLPRAEAAE